METVQNHCMWRFSSIKDNRCISFISTVGKISLKIIKKRFETWIFERTTLTISSVGGGESDEDESWGDSVRILQKQTGIVSDICKCG